MKKFDVDFISISDRLFSYVISIYQPDSKFPYPLQKGQKGSLYGSVFASCIASLLNRVPDLLGREKIGHELIALRDPSTQLINDDTLIPSDFRNSTNHSELYVSLQSTCFAFAALHALNIPFDPRVQWLTPILKKNTLRQWLDNLNWQNPWLVSNMDMFIGILLLEWHSFEPENKSVTDALNTYFQWHNEAQNPQTGFWGNQEDLFNAMAGAYHILLHYDYMRVPFSHSNCMIDSTLGFAWKDGLFVFGGGGGSCEDMDAIDILIRASFRTEYRSDEIQKILLNAAEMIYKGQSVDGGFSWRLQPRISTFARSVVNCKKSRLYSKIVYNLIYKLFYPSHYVTTNYYSSLSKYPYGLSQSDLWSSWFRPLALAFVAKRYPTCFVNPCDWKMPFWPGLGYTPFPNN